MSVNTLIKELKENEQDFEFYPTTDAMLETIAPYLDRSVVLDIGCGTCKFKKFMDAQKGSKIEKYYVIEKSKILLQKLEEDEICLGTDFLNTMLLDKKVDIIFCNPPYSQFMQWAEKIISEGNYRQAFLVIPQRWKDNQDFMNLLTKYNTGHQILGSFDFLDADRKARAKVDIVRFKKKRYSSFDYNSGKQEKFDTEAFDIFFDDLFGVLSKGEKDISEYEQSRKRESNTKDKIKNMLVETGESKAQILVNLYQAEYNTLIDHLKAIMTLDDEILKTFGFSINKVKEGLKVQITGLKNLYWKMVFEEFDEITSRLTSSSRNSLRNSFEELNCIDFTIENIYAVIIWVIKNANRYYNSQLIDFFKKLSDEENVKPYKSNQRLFEKDGYYWNCNGKRDYVLDYRIIMSSPFRLSWSGEFDKNKYNSEETLKDIFTIAKNLGFMDDCSISSTDFANDFGEKVYRYNGNKLFMEYKAYKNGNMHVKFDKEFTKAMNVEVSRLLGWIRQKEDISREFPAEMADGAEKYFNTNNFISITNNNLLLLETKAK